MRISDWSSDVCSSDLWPAFASVLTGETNLRPSPPSGEAIDRPDSVLAWLPQAAGANPKRELAVLFGLACGVRVAALRRHLGCGRRTVYAVRDRGIARTSGRRSDRVASCTRPSCRPTARTSVR